MIWCGSSQQSQHPQPYQGLHPGQGQGGLQGPSTTNINQSRNSVKFASPVRYSANRNKLNNHEQWRTKFQQLQGT